MMEKMTVAAVAACCAGVVQAASVHVAVAANFTAPAKELAPMFEKATGHKLVLSFGGTGTFYGQIKNGATYDVLLAADAKTPAKAVKEGYGEESSVFTYAVGRLVLWSSKSGYANDASVLDGDFNKLAVANPKLAPYGLAAEQTLAKLGKSGLIGARTVEGDNIGKTFNFVKTGNADLGFVALSQVFKGGRITSGSGWIVPGEYYDPIRQDAVLLKNGRNREAAKQFLEFLKSEQANAVKKAYGYSAI